MKVIRKYFLLALLISGFYACNRINPHHESSGMTRAVLMDSIHRLDSLVFLNKFSNRPRAVNLARTALQLAVKSEDTGSLILAYNTLGNSFSKDNVDSSYRYYSEALSLAEKARLIDSFPQVLFNIAMLYYQAADLKTTVRLLDSVVQMGRHGPRWNVVADAYNILGTVKLEVGLDSEALNYYRKAAGLSQQKNLFRQYGNALTNIANFEPDCAKAISLHQEAIRNLMKAPGDEPSIAGIYGNLGLLMKQPDSAIFYCLKGTEIAEKYGFREILISIWNNLAYGYLDKGELNLADRLIRERAIPAALKDSAYSQLATLCDTYADILNAMGKKAEAFDYLKLAIEYQARASVKTAGEQVRLLSALTEAKNRELLIRNQEIDIQLERTRARQYLTYLLIALVVATALILLFLWYRQQAKFKLQTVRLDSARRIIEAGESEKTELGRELHDISTHLSMGLRRIVDEVPLAEENDRQRLHEEIESARLTIRGLSHRLHKELVGSAKLRNLISALCEETVKTGIIDLDYALGESIPVMNHQTVLNSYRIVQELLSNATHHAPGSSVELDIYWNEGLYINYTDNGPGFEPGRVAGSMGLINIRDRILILGGRYTLNSAPGEGTSWEIFLPSEKNRPNPA